MKELIIEGECRLITQRLHLLKPYFLRKCLTKIIEDIKNCSITDDNLGVLLKVCLEYKDKQHELCDEQCITNYIKGLLMQFEMCCYSSNII